ncbi:MAG: glycosyltransferase [Hormoscilla sp.]
MPLISVIVPVYNGEKTILQTVESVLKQTFTDFELIVINDGSTDSTLEILSGIQDPRLQVFSYPNTGSNPSRNRGFAHSSGEYIAFLDADDLWTPDKLEAQLQALQENPQAAVAYSWSDCIDESGKFLRRGGYITVDGDAYAKLLTADILEHGSNPLIRRQALIEVGLFDESLPAAQDWDLYLRLAAKYDFVNVPRTQILYRISANSLSSNFMKLEKASLIVIERAFSQAPESLQHLKRCSLGNIYKYLTYKALAGTGRSRNLTAARFLWHTVINDPTFLRTPLISRLLVKIVVGVLLPPKKAQAFFNKFKGLPKSHETLLSYMEVKAS